MHRGSLLWLAAPVVLLPLSFAQAPATPSAQAAAAPSGGALATLFHDVWEDQLKHNPEFASAIGDRRYNDQLSDTSPQAFNDGLAREREFLMRLESIDMAGLAPQDKLAAHRLEQDLIGDEEAGKFKQWELPITPAHGMHLRVAADEPFWPFDTVKDFDDYIARLHKLPGLLRQASENMLAGIDDHKVEPAAVIQQALEQTEAVAGQRPEESIFAEPLERFPASIAAADRKRITAELLDAVQTDVLPAYVRFAKFLRVTALPAGQAQTTPVADHPFSYELREGRIFALRVKAQKALGTRFDLKAFHDQVDGSAALSTEALEQRIDAWVAASNRGM